MDIYIAVLLGFYIVICNGLAVRWFLQAEKEYAICIEAAKKHQEGYFASGKLIHLEGKILWLSAYGLSWFTIHNLVSWRKYKAESKLHRFRGKLKKTLYSFCAYLTLLIGSYAIFLLCTRSTLPR